MDLSRFNVSAAAGVGADLHLKHPSTGEDLFCKDGVTPFVIRVLGADAKSVREGSRALQERVAKGDLTKEEAAQNSVVLAICGWSDEMEYNGKPLPYSPENALKLMTDESSSWIAEQIAPFSLRRRNFAQNMT
ncbi:hypothetical protein [uncultured Ruegeria sp.]|uniref:hypothetical protein n=1 Tax=uncultured Ruegeria sp. TaxID=259304 RepID=UPI002611D6AF|nr:hypothetical protein [uncultured Ruegeria sp.]